MKKLLFFFLLVAVAAHQAFATEPNETTAITEAAKSYVAANSGMTKITVKVEQVEGDFGRAKVTPEDAAAADPAWVFLKKNDGKWTGLALGTSFTTEDYQQMGIPNSLRIP